MLLLRLRETLLQPMRPVLRGLDLTEQQARVLIILADAGATETGALAEMCCLLAASLERIVAKLEARSLVRCADLPDALPWQGEQVALTSLGERLTTELRLALRAPYSQLKRQMTEAGVARLTEALRSAIGYLGDPAVGEA